MEHEQERETQREGVEAERDIAIFHSLLHSPNGHNSLIWTTLKPGAWSSIQLSNGVAGAQAAGPSSDALLGTSPPRTWTRIWYGWLEFRVVARTKSFLSLIKFKWFRCTSMKLSLVLNQTTLSWLKHNHKLPRSHILKWVFPYTF